MRAAEAANIPTTLDQVGTVIADAGIPFAADSITVDSAADVFMAAGSTLFGSPLSISKIQSAYDSSALIDNTLVVTFTVQNTLPPVNLPVIPETATLTDTLELIQAVDYENDPNTIRNVVLANQFMGNASFIESNPIADTDGESYLWNVGDIPPLRTAEVAVKLQVEDSNLFVELDNGMQAWGTLYGRSATVSTAPIRLVPIEFSQWLIWTMDADYHDQYMLTKLSEVGTTADEIFAYIQSLGYEAYDGSLRGTRGTLWSEAGNAVDLSSLMIAMLRANGIPARYRHGTLIEAERANVILSMFPSVGARGGVVTEDVVTFDPANDPELLETVTDHWWVEAFTEGQGWVAYDPTVPDAMAGETFATDIEDPVAELPDALRHKVNVRVRTEHYHPLNTSGPLAGLDPSYPLEYTIRTVNFIGQPIQMGHIVDSQAQGGLVFSSKVHRYTPYLSIGEEARLVTGDTYEDMISNFPFGTTLTTGSWLEFEVQFPDGTVEKYEREIFDHVGYEARHGAPGVHNIDLSGLGDEPSIGEQSSYTFLLDSSRVSVDAINARFGKMVEAATTAQESAALVEALSGDENTSDSDLPLLRDASQKMTDATGLGQAVHLLTYAAASDLNTEQLGRTALIKGYHNAPRILTIGWDGSSDDDNVTVQFDLTRNAIQTVAYPGQTQVGLQAFNFARGIYEASIEGIIMEQFSGRKIRSVHHVFEEAARQNIPLYLITPANTDELAALQISDTAKARILTTLENSSEIVVVPGQMVTLDEEETIGWYQINTETGITIDTMENGQHFAGLAYAIFTGNPFQRALFKFIGFLQGFTAHILSYIGEVLGQAPITSSVLKGTLGSANGAADARVDEIESVFKAPKKTLVGAFAKGIDKGSDLAGTYINSTIDPPIPDAYYSRSVVNFSEEVVIWTTGTFPAALSDSGLDINVSTENTYLIGDATTSYATDGKNSAGYAQLAAANVTAPSGSGALNLDSAGSLTNDNAISVETQSTSSAHSFYAPAVTGMAHGTAWEAYTSTITPSTEAPFILRNAKGTLGNTEIDEALLQITTGDPLELSGSGATHAASFATTVDTVLNNGGLILGPSNTYPNGLAGWEMTGDVTITENGSTDSVVLNSTGSFFTLDVAPTTATVAPLQTATFQSTIAGNIAADYRLYLFLPAGWRGSLSPSGAVELTPSLDTAPGDYTTRVVAQVVDQPHIMLLAEQTVSVTQIDGVSVEITPDPYHTVPLGEAQNDGSLKNNGQIQLSDSAYNIAVHNTSSIPRQFTVSISEVDPAWLIFDGSYGDTEATIFLGSDEIATFGLYIEPPAEPLPEVGTTSPIQVNVAAVDNPAVAADHSIDFVMPGIAYGYMQSGPEIQYVAVGDTALVALYVENVGNAAGTFVITTTVETADVEQIQLVDPIVTQLEIDPSVTSSPQIAVDTTDAVVGQQYAVQSTLQNGPYRPISTALFEMVSAEAGCLYSAATTTSNYDELLTAALVQLGDDINDLTVGPEDSDILTEAHSSFDTVISLLPRQVDREPLIQVRNALPASLDTLCTTFEPAIEHLVLLSSTAFMARLSPGSHTALQGESVTYTLTLVNEATDESTYQVTTTALDEVEQQTLTLAPQQTEEIEIPVIVNTSGQGTMLGTIAAEVVVLENGIPITETVTQRTAALNVVDSLIQVVDVAADPAFVESGSGATDLSVEVLNVANRTLPTVIDIEVVAEDGTMAYSSQLTQTLSGAGITDYDLATVDTSGWENGNYRIHLQIRDEQGQSMTNGNGEGFLVVGAALQAFHSVAPAIVSPGDVTVTTLISTVVGTNTTARARLARDTANILNWSVPGLWATAIAPEASTIEGEEVVAAVEVGKVIESARGVADGDADTLPERMVEAAAHETLLDSQAAEVQMQAFVPQQMQNDTGIVRYEENHPDILYNGVPFTQTTGGWRIQSGNNASDGSYARTDTVSDTISLTFNGSWINLGFLSGSDLGVVEISLDGTSRGQFDLYANRSVAKDLIFADLASGTHTIEIKLLDERNPFSNVNRVYLDYIDIWDGTLMADGDFSETDERISRTTNWTFHPFEGARDGNYMIRGRRAWFPFTGDSVSFHTLAYSSGGEMEIYIDGESRGLFSAYSAETISRTFSFNGLGDGPHIMLIHNYRGNASVDGFSTPGVAPFVESTTPTGFIRYEEDHPDMRYNGLPYEQTSTSWSMQEWSRTSDGYYARSQTISDTFSLDFEGSWVNIGMLASNNGGIAEIFLDGVSQGEIDLYAHHALPKEVQFSNLGSGSHTVQVILTDKQNPLARNQFIEIDYIDVWDGTPIADGEYSETDGRIYSSTFWRVVASDAARDGTYMRSAIRDRAWFPFTGDSASFHTLAYSGGGEMEIYIDGESRGLFSAYSAETISRTFSFNGLGDGPHIMLIRSYRGNASVDGFSTPGVAPFVESTTLTGFVRYEEDHPDMRYNGLPYQQTSISWSMHQWNVSSDGYYARSETISDTFSLSFEGEWVNIGMLAANNGGIAEIFLDGISQGEIDLYADDNQPREVLFSNLGNGPHTIEVMATGRQNPLARNQRIYLDYIDVWDGSPIAEGEFSETDSRILRGWDWNVRSFEGARDGTYMRDGSRAWFPFTEDSVSFHTLAYDGGGDVEIYLDGTSIGVYSVYSFETMTRTYSFNELGTGLHMMTVVAHDGTASIDGFETPGIAPFRPKQEVQFERISDSVTGIRSQTLTYTIDLHNLGTTPDEYTIMAQGQWFTGVSTSTVALKPTENHPVVISYTVPLETPIDTVNRIVMTATSNSDSTLSSTFALNIYNVEPPTTQICIALDASGSIEPEDFELMKQGLANALRDPTVIPRDGSVELSIIQFSSGANVEVVPTTILAEDVARRITEQILAINKIAGGTPTHLAIDSCTHLLTNSIHFNRADNRVINLVTDGAANNPALAVTSRNAAVEAGITQLNVEAIGLDEDTIDFLRDELVWPQPGYLAPPFVVDAGGFVIPVETFEDFAEALRKKFGFIVENTGIRVQITHTVPLSDVETLVDTIEPVADRIDQVDESKDIYWAYVLSGEDPSRGNQFDTLLPNMQPGEIRQLSQETVIAYQYSGGSNTLRLPPLYVMAERIISLSPSEQVANPSSVATYDVTLHNPATTADTYTLEVLGLPADWVRLPQRIAIAAQESVTEQLQINVPADIDLADYPFAVRVTNETGGQDQAEGVLTIVDAFALAVAPQLLTTQSAQPLTYTITLTNLQPTNRTYSLTMTGIDPTLMSYPATVDVPANSAVTVSLHIVAPAQQGSHLFEVLAQTPQVQAVDMAGVTVEDERSVEIGLHPAFQTTGRGLPALFTVSVTNTGSVADVYDLQVTLPSEWSASFDANGIAVTELELSPYLFNATDVTLLVTPPADVVSGDHDFTVMAQSQQHSAVQSSISGTVNILEQGVAIELTPETQTISPDETASWDVIVTNSGTVADTFVLTSTGVIAGMAEFSTDRLTLEPNQSETVQITAANFNEVTMKRYLVGVTAQSQSADEIQATDTGELLFSPYEDVELTWRPDRRTITATSAGPYVTDYLLSITNHGNVGVNYDLTFLADTLQAIPELDQVYIFPKMTSAVLVTVVADESGIHEVEGFSVSESGDSRDSEMATLEIRATSEITGTTPTSLQVDVEPESADHFLYLPILFQVESCIDTDSATSDCGGQSDIPAVRSSTHSLSPADTQVVYLPVLFR